MHVTPSALFRAVLVCLSLAMTACDPSSSPKVPESAMASSAAILAVSGTLSDAQRKQLIADREILSDAVKNGGATLNPNLNSYSQRVTEIEQRLAAAPR